MRKLVVLLVLLTSLVIPSLAQAATTTFRVSPLGTFVSPNAAVIRGTVTCDAGPWTITFTSLATPYTVNGTVAGTCSGVSQPWTAPIVGGPWGRGQAITFGATLVTQSGTVFQVPKVVLQ